MNASMSEEDQGKGAILKLLDRANNRELDIIYRFVRELVEGGETHEDHI